jgi:hypothetical protein
MRRIKLLVSTCAALAISLATAAIVLADGGGPAFPR